MKIVFVEVVELTDFVVYEKSGHALDKDPEAAQKAKEIIKNYAEVYFAKG